MRAVLTREMKNGNLRQEIRCEKFSDLEAIAARSVSLFNYRIVYGLSFDQRDKVWEIILERKWLS